MLPLQSFNVMSMKYLRNISIEVYIVAYIDDILIYAKTEEQLAIILI